MMRWADVTARVCLTVFGSGRHHAPGVSKAGSVLPGFDVMKAIQACAVLLKAEPGHCMGRLRLLKLLYIAERESLAKTRRFITNDTVVAMDHGPVLSHTYNLIKGEVIASPTWDEFFESQAYKVKLRQDPGLGELSRREIAKLHEVSEHYANVEDWTVRDLTHLFPEWDKNQPPKGSSKRIPLDDILEATGTTADKAAILDMANGQAAFRKLFGQ